MKKINLLLIIMLVLLTACPEDDVKPYTVRYIYKCETKVFPVFIQLHYSPTSMFEPYVIYSKDEPYIIDKNLNHNIFPEGTDSVLVNARYEEGKNRVLEKWYKPSSSYSCKNIFDINSYEKKEIDKYTTSYTYTIKLEDFDSIPAQIQ